MIILQKNVANSVVLLPAVEMLKCFNLYMYIRHYSLGPSVTLRYSHQLTKLIVVWYFCVTMVESLYKTTFTGAEGLGPETPTIFTFYVHFVVETRLLR